MKVWMAYRVTMHGEPVYPDFIFRAKHLLITYLEKKPKFDNYVIKGVDLDVPKYGISDNEFKKERLMVEGNIKDVSITFRNDDGTLNQFIGKEALEVIKKLKKEKEQ